MGSLMVNNGMISLLQRLMNREKLIAILPWEHGSLPDVVEAEVEHADPLHSNPTSGMRRAAVSDQDQNEDKRCS